jgi:hypothetical protein
MLPLKWNLPKNQLLYPFAKFQYYDGGKKFEKMLEVIRLEIMN